MLLEEYVVLYLLYFHISYNSFYFPFLPLALILGRTFISLDFFLNPRDFFAALVRPLKGLFVLAFFPIQLIFLSFFISGLLGSTRITS